MERLTPRPQSWCFGVIAGVSHRLQWSTGWTRLAVVGLALLAPVKVVLIYLAAAWLLPTSWRGC
ncbi:phage shock protein C, PspC [Ferrimonas balearica DSM 9799]|uniref:Phage shock protein C, PspC n=1 Tax=Ferrimonas balearica (strain DSM 9799 / CCM 4581 / KCTC 23876 / PAT) TaxID=550540 RepID=E1SWN0_FERBD|nr:PspC domain-containing protein [Ferrimonas balearica]MBY6017993.1 PspC domain-containing protein [Halomonas denitrificans]ADN77492.1 phage shock protein C, PspC [Ferrimonas balearica DSM 9799]MBW3139517.1 PspC domain-containing protein [Ferrimonas balearica]MBW3164544.1 PspC domain-containing protein [Ferrimonas balearica]MBY5980596.1 PspC domain-containing protein [Ferrimonas balearica]